LGKALEHLSQLGLRPIASGKFPRHPVQPKRAKEIGEFWSRKENRENHRGIRVIEGPLKPKKFCEEFRLYPEDLVFFADADLQNLLILEAQPAPPNPPSLAKLLAPRSSLKIAQSEDFPGPPEVQIQSA
jgi:hypothetical protein